MSDKAASILARLKNLSISTGRPYQLCLQLFCQEEFIRRLQKSKYSDHFVLKGGFFIYTFSNFSSRVTVDIDFLIRRLSNSPEHMKQIFREIVDTASGHDYITFEIRDVKPISLFKKYPGVRVYLTGIIKNTRTPFEIDVGIGDAVVPAPVTRMIPTQLDDFEPPLVQTYTIESTIAEKFDAMLSLMNASSSLKDYYDIYYLSHTYSLEGEVLVEAMKQTFATRNHQFKLSTFNEFKTLQTDLRLTEMWHRYGKKLGFPSLEFSQLMNELERFLEKPFHCAMTGEILSGTWDPKDLVWR